MTTGIGNALRLLAGIGALSAAGFPAFAQSGPPGWTPLAPIQTLAPTQQETSAGSTDSPPATLNFGAAIAVDQGTALIGMPGYPGRQNSGTSNEGAVAIFVQGTGSWARDGTLSANDVAAGDFFGERVALRGDLAAAQAESGIYIFRRTGSGWSEIQKLVPPAGTRFDGGLAIGNATIFVGAPAYGVPGEVFVFEPDLNGTWHPVQTLASGDEAGSDYFGGEIAEAGGTLVIGAAGDNAAFVFAQRNAGWSEQQKLAPPDEPASASFGAALAVSQERIVVGAPQADTNPSGDCAEAAGAVYVFALQGSTWQQQTKMATPAPDCTASFSTGLFGTEVSVNADHVVGATPSLFPNQAGAVFDFASDGAAEVPAGDATDPSLVSTPVLALSDEVLFVGLPYDQGSSTGITEIFDLSGASSPAVGAGKRIFRNNGHRNRRSED